MLRGPLGCLVGPSGRYNSLPQPWIPEGFSGIFPAVRRPSQHEARFDSAPALAPPSGRLFLSGRANSLVAHDPILRNVRSATTSIPHDQSAFVNGGLSPEPAIEACQRMCGAVIVTAKRFACINVSSAAVRDMRASSGFSLPAGGARSIAAAAWADQLLPLIAIRWTLAFASRDLGNVTVSTPFLNEADALSPSTSSSGIRRSKRP